MLKYSLFIYEKNNQKKFSLRDNKSGLFVACGFGEKTINEQKDFLNNQKDSFEILDFSKEKFACDIFEK